MEGRLDHDRAKEDTVGAGKQRPGSMQGLGVRGVTEGKVHSRRATVQGEGQVGQSAYHHAAPYLGEAKLRQNTEHCRAQESE